MIPKIIFRYSMIYDKGYRHSKKIHTFLEKENLKYPSVKQIENFIVKIEREWRKHERKILKEIAKVTGLKWKDKTILCYVIGCGIPFSDPLTIGILGRTNPNDFIDILTHELIHQIQIQNSKVFERWWQYAYKKYKKETFNTRVEISVHVIHYKLLANLFGTKRLKKNIEKDKIYPDYKRAWKIVEEEGVENIIKKFKELTKSK